MLDSIFSTRSFVSALSLAACAAVVACEPLPPEEEDPVWEIGYEGDDSFGALLSVWGPSTTNIYSVGGNPEAGAMLHFDGSEWSEEALPEAFPLANWVFGAGDFGTDDSSLWVAGNDGQIARQTSDGSWSTTDLGTLGDLWGIWGTADDDMFVVGGDIPGDGPVLSHFDGNEWTPAELPELDRDLDALFKIWGSGPDDVFAVGRYGVILHYDGSTWEQQLAGTSSDLISLWGTGPGEIVAVGGRSSGVIARYDGQSWSSETIGMLPGLNGVWVDDAGTGFAVGLEGFALEIPAGSFDYVELDRSVRPDVLHGAFGFADGSRVGVGGNLLFSPPWTGVILQFMQP